MIDIHVAPRVLSRFRLRRFAVQYENLRKRLKLYAGQVIVDALEHEDGHAGRAERIITANPPTTVARQIRAHARRASVRRILRRGSRSTEATVAAKAMTLNRRSSAPILLPSEPPARRRRQSIAAGSSPPARSRRCSLSAQSPETTSSAPALTTSTSCSKVASLLSSSKSENITPASGGPSAPAEGGGAAPAQTLGVLDRLASVASPIADFRSSQQVRDTVHFMRLDLNLLSKLCVVVVFGRRATTHRRNTAPPLSRGGVEPRAARHTAAPLRACACACVVVKRRERPRAGEPSLERRLSYRFVAPYPLISRWFRDETTRAEQGAAPCHAFGSSQMPSPMTPVRKIDDDSLIFLG